MATAFDDPGPSDQQPSTGEQPGALGRPERGAEAIAPEGTGEVAGVEPGATRPASASASRPSAAESVSGEPLGASWSAAEWQGKMLMDRDGAKLGKLQDVYIDVETDEPQFGTVKEGRLRRHLTFVPLGVTRVSPDGLQVGVSKEQVKDAPNIELHGDELSPADESALYHHYEMNYTPPALESGRRLARR